MAWCGYLQFFGPANINLQAFKLLRLVWLGEQFEWVGFVFILYALRLLGFGLIYVIRLHIWA
jgi:hypothetical protein